MFTTQQLIAAGFVEKQYEGQEGVFYIKEIVTPKELLPAFCDEEYLPETCVIEYLPDGGLQYMLDFDLGAFDRFDQGSEGYQMLVNLSGLCEGTK